jgi:hypothetical protein
LRHNEKNIADIGGHYLFMLYAFTGRAGFRGA